MGRSTLLAICFLMCVSLVAQPTHPNYIYGCENCAVTGVRIVGPNKVLEDFGKTGKRRLILLDSQNLQVDEIEVNGPVSLVPTGPYTVKVRELGAVVDLSIRNHTFQIDTFMPLLGGFSAQHGLMYPIQTQYYLIGGGQDGFYYLPLDQELYTLERRVRTDEYNQKGKVERALFGHFSQINTPELTRHADVNMRAFSAPFIDVKPRQEKQTYFPAWDNIEIDGENLFVFSRVDQVFYRVQLTPDRPQIIDQVKLPVKNPNREGWIHYYDFQEKQHYFVLDRNGHIWPGMGYDIDRKTRKRMEQATDWSWELFRLDGQKLTRLSNLPFRPADIEGGFVYELRQTGKKSSDVYAYPFDPKRVDDIWRMYIKE